MSAISNKQDYIPLKIILDQDYQLVKLTSSNAPFRNITASDNMHPNLKPLIDKTYTSLEEVFSLLKQIKTLINIKSIFPSNIQIYNDLQYPLTLDEVINNIDQRLKSPSSSMDTSSTDGSKNSCSSTPNISPRSSPSITLRKISTPKSSSWIVSGPKNNPGVARIFQELQRHSSKDLLPKGKQSTNLDASLSNFQLQETSQTPQSCKADKPQENQTDKKGCCVIL